MKKNLYKEGYVASPLNAPTERKIRANMRRAFHFEYVCKLLCSGRSRAPQAYMPQLLDDNIPEEREIALRMGLQMLDKSDAIILCGRRVSNGMAAELKKALETELKVYVLSGPVCNIKVVNWILAVTGRVSLQEVSSGEAKVILTRREIA